MWARIKAWCLNSTTMAWSYILMISGVFVSVGADAISLLMNTEFADAVRGALPEKWVGWFVILIGAVTFLTRLRGVLEAMRAKDPA